jgi:hypothetical protein
MSRGKGNQGGRKRLHDRVKWLIENTPPANEPEENPAGGSTERGENKDTDTGKHHRQKPLRGLGLIVLLSTIAMLVAVEREAFSPSPGRGIAKFSWR